MRTVRYAEGDSFTRYAKENGFASWRAIWDHAANAALRAKRHETWKCLPGDAVTIPDPEVKVLVGGTESIHEFKAVVAKPAVVRIVDDLGAPAAPAAVVRTRVEVSNRITTADLPAGFADPSTDRDNFKIEVEDEGEGGDSIPAARVTLEALRNGRTHVVAAGESLSRIAARYGIEDWRTITQHPRNRAWAAAHPDPNVIHVGERLWIPLDHDPADFAPARTLQVELHRVAGTKRFRSRYLRLVVDDQDLAAAPTQTLLTDWDSTDHAIDILGQYVRVRYTGSSGEVVAARATVGGATRSRIALAVHIVRTAPGAAGVVTEDDARVRVFKWWRRLYAQISMAPDLKLVRTVDPLENLISVSDYTGANATGGAGRQARFTLRATRAGVADKVAVIGPRAFTAGDTPITTANALAALINADGTFNVRVVQNPPPLDVTIAGGSADLVITDPDGGRVTVEALAANDPLQTITVGRVNVGAFVGWAAGGRQDWVIGSIQQRVLAQAYDTGSDRIDLFVIGAHTSGDRGQALMPGNIYTAGRQAIAQVIRSATVAQIVMDGTDNNPVSGPHECGHVMLDAIHATVNTQVMRNGTSGDHPVDGSKRFDEAAVAYDTPAVGIAQEARIRANGAAVLSPLE